MTSALTCEKCIAFNKPYIPHTLGLADTIILLNQITWQQTSKEKGKISLVISNLLSFITTQFPVTNNRNSTVTNRHPADAYNVPGTAVNSTNHHPIQQMGKIFLSLRACSALLTDFSAINMTSSPLMVSLCLATICAWNSQLPGYHPKQSSNFTSLPHYACPESSSLQAEPTSLFL